VSVAVWVAVLWALWWSVSTASRFWRVRPARRPRVWHQLDDDRPLAIPGIERALGGAWIWVHIGLVLLGIAAFVLNFAGP